MISEKHAYSFTPSLSLTDVPVLLLAMQPWVVSSALSPGPLLKVTAISGGKTTVVVSVNTHFHGAQATERKDCQNRKITQKKRIGCWKYSIYAFIYLWSYFYVSHLKKIWCLENIVLPLAIVNIVVFNTKQCPCLYQKRQFRPQSLRIKDGLYTLSWGTPRK